MEVYTFSIMSKRKGKEMEMEMLVSISKPIHKTIYKFTYICMNIRLYMRL